jgi:hypothetical protein
MAYSECLSTRSSPALAERTWFSQAHMRWIVVTKSRGFWLEKMKELVLGDQVATSLCLLCLNSPHSTVC